MAFSKYKYSNDSLISLVFENILLTQTMVLYSQYADLFIIDINN